MSRAKRWHDEFEKLRKIILECHLTEDLKWGTPCYTLQGRNVVLMHGFKEYCALLFFKGALLRDPERILIRQTANVHSSRQIRFTSLREINKLKPVLKNYVREAVEVEESGRKVEPKKTAEFAVAAEFKSKLDKLPALKKAFSALTPGRQRAYLLYFSSAKLSTTRASRVEKSMSRILAGKGLDD